VSTQAPTALNTSLILDAQEQTSDGGSTTLAGIIAGGVVSMVVIFLLTKYYHNPVTGTKPQATEVTGAPKPQQPSLAAIAPAGTTTEYTFPSVKKVVYPPTVAATNPEAAPAAEVEGAPAAMRENVVYGYSSSPSLKEASRNVEHEISPFVSHQFQASKPSNLVSPSYAETQRIESGKTPQRKDR
jgi:hypothetical protein